ncbi:MAG: FAD:protein FMN transferase, partial [Desulfobacterales bacterium]
MKRSIKIAGMLSLIFLFFGCSLKKEALIAGETMGTTYHIRIVSWFFQSRADLKAKIKTRLNEINRSMSNYMKESEISRFNDFRNLNEKFFISDDFYQVMKVADRVYRLSQGAWDGTVKPLVDLWGFGSAEGEKRIPTEDEIDNRLLDVGF